MRSTHRRGWFTAGSVSPRWDTSPRSCSEATGILAVVRVRLLIVIGLLAPLAGCGLFGGPDPADTASAFLSAIARGDAGAAARLTDHPPAATELIRQVRTALEPESVRMTLDATEESPQESDETATATFTASWQLGNQR